jgi:hypothetical protein
MNSLAKCSSLYCHTSLSNVWKIEVSRECDVTFQSNFIPNFLVSVSIILLVRHCPVTKGLCWKQFLLHYRIFKTFSNEAVALCLYNQYSSDSLTVSKNWKAANVFDRIGEYFGRPEAFD